MEIDRSLCESSWKSVEVGGSRWKSMKVGGNVEIDMEARVSQWKQI